MTEGRSPTSAELVNLPLVAYCDPRAHSVRSLAFDCSTVQHIDFRKNFRAVGSHVRNSTNIAGSFLTLNTLLLVA
jgi:hypothetical protein